MNANTNMSTFETMFRACCEQIVILAPPEHVENASYVEQLCKRLTSMAILNHMTTGVLDFEQIVSVDIAWWIYGVFYTLTLSLTVLLNLFSIHIFLDASTRSPTTCLLAAITVLDLLTCLSHAPVNIHAYLSGRYRELPSYIWCEIYNYVHNFLPSALHSTAFLLNMFLSVQRCAGVREIKRLRNFGTYKSSIAAILLCALFSFSVHAMYPVTVGIESVTAISKKVVGASGYDYTQSCRVVPRFRQNYVALYSSYLWLRVSLLQVTPALIITVCNITLIQASYKTYLYRKRLVGALGVITDSNPSSLVIDNTFLSSHGSCDETCTGETPTSSEPSTTEYQQERPDQIIYTRRSFTAEAASHSRGRHRSQDDTLNKCFRERISSSERVSTTALIYNPGENKRFSTGNIASFYKHRRVAPLTSVGRILEEVTSDRNAHAGYMAQNRHLSISTIPVTLNCLSGDTTRIPYGCLEPVVDKHTESSCEHFKTTSLFAADLNTILMQKESENAYFENSCKTSQCAVLGGNANNVEIRKASLSHFAEDENNLKGCCPNQDIILNEENASLSTQSDVPFVANNMRPPSGSIRTLSTLALPKGSFQSRNSNISSPSSLAHSYINNRIKPMLSTQHSISSISAEVRSSIILLLVTSCTLLAEVFVLILLILLFLNSFVWPNNEFLRHSDLSTAIMVSNAIMNLTFPLNFFFFYGLSQAFRSALSSRLRTLLGRRTRTSYQP